MRHLSSGPRRYDSLTQALHWITALLVAGQWLGAQVIDWFPKGPLRVDVRSAHIVCGLVLGLLLVGRIVWRVTAGRKLPPADTGALHLLAVAAHLLLYVLVAAMVMAGLVLAWTRGDSLFGLFSIPAYRPGDHALVEQVQDLHGAIGWAIVLLVGAHAAAALAHRHIWKDQVFERMLPLR